MATERRHDRQTGAVDPRMTASTDTSTATASRVAARLAVGLGVLTVGLGAGTLFLTSRAATGGTLPGRISEALYLTAGVPFSVVGALICARRPGNRIGWLMIAAGLSFTRTQFGDWYATHGGLAPARPLVAWITVWIWVPAVVALMFLLLLYPTGRLVSRRWRPVAWAVGAWGVLGVAGMALAPPEVAGAVVSNPIGLPEVAREFIAKTIGVGLGSLLVLLLVSLLSLVVRFYRARGIERQQLKWLVYAASLALVATFFFPAAWWTYDLLPRLSVWAIPVAIGVAVLRYRLYEIDRLVNRTLVYATLTVLLGGAYAGVVLGLGQLLGRDSSLVVAVATLAVAAVFQPARRRIQQAMDRRFNRRRYDAARTIAAFSARLRQQVDLDTLTGELLGVVEETMQPTRVSLWLRSSVSAATERHGTGASRATSPPTAASRSVGTTL
jgi:hypothetical protein